jgi:penicillin-binding protein 2
MTRHTRIAALAALAITIAACSPALPQSVFPTPVPSPTSPAGIGAAASTAAAFVDALNRTDYAAAHQLLDTQAQRDIATPAALQAAYDAAKTAARTLTITAQLRGGLLPNPADASQADAQLGSVWESPLLGSFEVTTSLQLVSSPAEGWRVRWTRNAIAPGLVSGNLAIESRWLSRASVYGSDGTLISGPSERTRIGIQRNQIRDAAEEQQILALFARLTGKPPAEIQQIYINQPPDWYVPIATLDVDLVESAAAEISNHAAIIATPTFVRSIYRPDIAPHVIGVVGAITPETLERYAARGYTGDERVGVSGIEAGAEQILAGRPELILRVVGDGKVRTITRVEALRGSDVTLTLNPALQLTAQQLLDRRRGAIVVMRANDGGVLAMASYPTFDPTNVLNEDVQSGALLNRATQGLYPPGSTFKMVTMAAALGEGVASIDTVFRDPGFWTGYGSEFRKNCWRNGGHGNITLANGLTASCNIVFYEIGKQLEERGSGVLPAYARKFGFGSASGIELAGEQAGVVPDPDYKQQVIGETWWPGDTVNMSVGQGYVLVTPLQIARMTMGIANGGRLEQPFLVDAPRQPKPEPARLPIAPGDLIAMQDAMSGVTTNGRIGTTTYRFTTFDYYEINGAWVAGKELSAAQRRSARKLVVAGKSGTAQAPGNTLPFAWFTAYAPADAPQIVVTVLLENAGQGSAQAGPVARQMTEAFFGLPISPTPKDALEND